MKLKYLLENKLDVLLANIKSNLENGNYIKKEIWIDKYFNEEFVVDSDIEVSDIQLLIPEKGGTDTDFKNSKILYTALKNITVEQASDGRLWGYLTHVVFWNYMRNRWPADGKNDKFIKSRYFIRQNSDRSLVRNGLARLWWMAYSTYDNSLDDKFEVTKFLFKDTDLQTGLIERSFSRNKDLTKNILKSLMKYTYANGFPKRSSRRKLWREINRIGGVKVLDLLDFHELDSMINKILKNIDNEI